MNTELTIIVKDAEKKKLSMSFNIYETFTFKESDPVIKSYIEQAIREFKGVPEDVIVKAQMTLQ